MAANRVSPKTVGTVFGVIFVALICALAYNMGGSSEEVLVSERLAAVRQQLTREEQRKDLCEKAAERFANDANREDSAVQGLADTIDETKQRIASLTNQIAELQANALQCESQRQSDSEAFAKSPTADLNLRIRKANIAVAAAQQMLLDANATRAAKNKDILRLIYAYHQANEMLEKKSKA